MAGPSNRCGNIQHNHYTGCIYLPLGFSKSTSTFMLRCHPPRLGPKHHFWGTSPRPVIQRHLEINQELKRLHNIPLGYTLGECSDNDNVLITAVHHVWSQMLNDLIACYCRENIIKETRYALINIVITCGHIIGSHDHIFIFITQRN